MHALRIVLGVFIALAGLFIGGCSLFFSVVFLTEDSGGYDFWVIPVAGLVATPFLVLGAWLLLRGQFAARGIGASRAAAGAFCGLVSLALIGSVALKLAAPWALAYPPFTGVVLLQILVAAAAGWAGYKLLTPPPASPDSEGSPPTE